MTANEVISALKADGWFKMKGKKSGHQHFKHTKKPGKVTVPRHSGDLPLIIIKSIEKQAGLKLRG